MVHWSCEENISLFGCYLFNLFIVLFSTFKNTFFINIFIRSSCSVFSPLFNGRAQQWTRERTNKLASVRTYATTPLRET